MTMKWILSFALLAGVSGTAHAQFAAEGPSVVATKAGADWGTPPVNEQQEVTHGSVTTRRGPTKYAATAGTITIRDVNAKPIASVFYVAYTVDPKSPRPRPVTFIYNGGPGSASVLMHMGSFAPVRIAADQPEPVAPAPNDPVVPNADTLLDSTDLVFIDAIGTGYSRPLGDTSPHQFWGIDSDADAFARTIIGYIGKYDRWNSPKFIMGESYGTFRSAVLAYQLQQRGIALNGVILQSTILNMGMYQSGYDMPAIGFLPTYAAIAWHYHLVPDPAPDLATAVQRARDFTNGPYSAALARGVLLDRGTASSIAKRMASLTGLSERFILDANLRVDSTAFQKELLRDKGVTIGHADARFMGIDSAVGGAAPETDASTAAINPAYTAGFRAYLSNRLGYSSKMPYLLAAYSFSDFKWDDRHNAPDGTPQEVGNAGVDLAATMRANPYLQVLSLNGYYDLSTPFANTEYDLSHMPITPALMNNISSKYYASGHMTYLDPDARRQMHDDIAVFIDRSVSVASQGRRTVAEYAR
jgi:carboxypeptidase C (cathepsin A)